MSRNTQLFVRTAPLGELGVERLSLVPLNSPSADKPKQLLTSQNEGNHMPGHIHTEMVNLNGLFAGNIFLVPQYQRAYAWERKQWQDLWEDIREGMLNQTEHYLGTVVLRDSGKTEVDAEGIRLKIYEVVDGQQRLTTMSLLILALYNQLRGKHNDRIGPGIWRDFIQQDDKNKMRLGGTNAQFLLDLTACITAGQILIESTRQSNKRVLSAYNFFNDKLQVLSESNDQALQLFAGYVRNDLQVLMFVTSDQALAIKTFETVNDRGKPLSLLDKAKSFLMFYATKYLSTHPTILCDIELGFGTVFEQYDRLRDLAELYGIDYFTNPRYRFSEDDLLRFCYHYFASYSIATYGIRGTGYNFDITANDVFNNFVKIACHELRESSEHLLGFAKEFVDALSLLSRTIADLIESIPTNQNLERLLRWQGPSASVYPLLVAAAAENILDAPLQRKIEVLDMRVYKIRGTDPKADLYRDAIAAIRRDPMNRAGIDNAINWFITRFGPDAAIDSYLRTDVFRNAYTKYVLWEFSSFRSLENGNGDYDLYRDLQVEHIFPQEPSFDVTSYGFENEEDYFANIHQFGNLCLLERSINTSASNDAPLAKASQHYGRSQVRATRLLGEEIQNSGFSKPQLQVRTDQIVNFVKQNWPVGIPVVALSA